MSAPLTFDTLPLQPALLENLASLGYETMTPIQAAALPVILQLRDLIAQAKTGSGKTAAFGLGLLNKLNPTYFAVQGLVICPTRELADQVANELRRLARRIENVKIVTLTGGIPMRPQIATLEFGAHIVVGTPGRLIDHISRGTLKLNAIQTLVLDEADRMVDMGFYEDIYHIAAACSPRRQTLLFSATYPDDIRAASEQLLNQPEEIQVEVQHSDNQIQQWFFLTTPEQRNAAVGRLLQHYQPASSIAFCNTKIHCRELTEELHAQGISALALHGDMEQRDRDEVLIRFANQSCSVLVATDVAARGLDIQNLGAVINVDVSKDSEVHVHRIGRSGRAGEQGLALTLATPGEKKWVRNIEEYSGIAAQWLELDSLDVNNAAPLQAPMQTLCIQGGKKDKLRPGDLLGALCADLGLQKAQVGKINVSDFVTFVAIERSIAEDTLNRLSRTQIKGRQFRMRMVG